jgi:hypothetical protein
MSEGGCFGRYALSATFQERCLTLIFLSSLKIFAYDVMQCLAQGRPRSAYLSSNSSPLTAGHTP